MCTFRLVHKLIVLSVAFLVLVGAAPTINSEPPTDPPVLDVTESFHFREAAERARGLELSRSLRSRMDQAVSALETVYDVKWYDIIIRVNDTTEMLHGQVTMRAEVLEDNVTQVALNLFDNMPISSVWGVSGNLPYSHGGNAVTVDLDRSYDAGEEFEFTIAYSGPGTNFAHRGFSWAWFGNERAISSHGTPRFSQTWWPCKDRTDDKADSVSLHIEVDSSLYCASNGSLDSITDVGSGHTQQYHYSVGYPIATYLVSIEVAPFVVWEQEYVGLDGVTTMPVVHHVHASNYASSLVGWEDVPDMIGTLAESFGEYPFIDEKYGHATRVVSGGMEHQTLTSIATGTYGYRWSLVVHELAHQWWGDMVTCASWEDVWLNEGWGTYSEAEYLLATNGWSAYHQRMGYYEYYGGGTVWCSDTTDPSRIFNGYLSYYKGAWVVHMLRGVVGETLFKRGVDAYYNSALKYGSVSTADFVEIWETALHMDLDWFFDQWVYGEYYPSYHYWFMSEPSDDGGYDTYLAVRQTPVGGSDPFRMPVDFFFDWADQPDDTLMFEVKDAAELFKINRPGPVNNIVLDPSKWILKQAQSHSWEMFIISSSDDLHDGVEDEAYVDTIEIRGATGPLEIRVISGYSPPGLEFSSEGIISGVPTEAGTFMFLLAVVDPAAGYADQAYITLVVHPPACCVGRVGDANDSGADEPTIGDVTTMIDLLFITADPATVPCLAEADINQTGGDYPEVPHITLSDVSILIDYLFITGPSLILPDCL